MFLRQFVPFLCILAVTSVAAVTPLMRRESEVAHPNDAQEAHAHHDQHEDRKKIERQAHWAEKIERHEEAAQAHEKHDDVSGFSGSASGGTRRPLNFKEGWDKVTGADWPSKAGKDFYTEWGDAVKEVFGADNLIQETTGGKTERDVTKRAISVANLEKVRDLLSAIAAKTSDGKIRVEYKGNIDTEAPENATMYMVANLIVGPMTVTSQLSFVGLVQGTTGDPTHFISHYWGGRFFKFVDAVVAHCGDCNKATTYYWVCTFANNQHKLGEALPEGAGPEESSFARVLKNIKASGTGIVLSVQDGVTVPTINRIWCQFELQLAFELDIPLEVACETGAVIEYKKDQTARSVSSRYRYDYKDVTKKCSPAWCYKWKTCEPFEKAGGWAEDKKNIGAYIKASAKVGPQAKGWKIVKKQKDNDGLDNLRRQLDLVTEKVCTLADFGIPEDQKRIDLDPQVLKNKDERF